MAARWRNKNASLISMMMKPDTDRGCLVGPSSFSNSEAAASSSSPARVEQRTRDRKGDASFIEVTRERDIQTQNGACSFRIKRENKQGPNGTAMDSMEGFVKKNTKKYLVMF